MVVPPGVVTDTFPEDPEPTMAVMLVDETTLNEAAAVPPKLTEVAPSKSVPVMVMVAPVPPVEVKVDRTGGSINVKPVPVAVPPGVVTDTLPDAPKPTTAVILVGEITLNELAAVPPKLTAEVPVKPVPVMVIE